ncbi:UDP-N-acetylmuramoyl-tripeptide--D-alanyl-D-alanine ligase [Vibrio sp. 99-70-13A1]|uniref:UDP-N-acetylmuramoyl-tripeptide--D-alanyl-D- alanine ligase n=1 Tax=Vibrio sp. 99-70-13A1 TaxID=2607601 RepID=UPI0014939976|nr:UDP-N-acetylmuramoyl-tripeptide--D-alanyl-D-alanine ligase [Vibrio sp. 99-70-13A1]NOH96817.1 UDP-N-acetylmuramoyl-tripeptide--D-alanyl-D-alanine ligase [Vibrio sp. 99-70-13A1]
MIDVSLEQICSAVKGKLIGEDCTITAVSTDTRTLDTGALFVALVGERFDAHDFCQQVVDAKANALLVEKKLDFDIPQVIVEDSKIALGQLGSWVHKQCDIPTMAITGSCGKTTVKEMVASILQLRGNVLFTAGNFNNEIGVPLTLLRSEREAEFAVIELGANHIGEIAYTTQLVLPQVALVNNVAAAHLEGFGSIDGVKQAKGEIFQGLPPGGTAILNLESNGGRFWDDVLSDKSVVTFSTIDTEADYFARNIEINTEGEASFELNTPIGSIDVKLGIIGRHNVANALAAAALAIQFGSTLKQIQAGLTDLIQVKGRVEVQPLTEKIKLIDDSYNASVPAMKAAAELLSGFQGQRWLILGNMAELGDESLALHRQVGEYAAPFNFEYVLTYGEDTKVISDVCNGIHFETHSEMITYIKQQLALSKSMNHTLLVKGANSAGMSKIAVALKETFS